MRKSFLMSTISGVICAIVIANLLHAYTNIVDVGAIGIGLLVGLEVGYWSYDWRLSVKAHREFLLIPFRRIPLGFYLFLVAFGSLIFSAYLAIEVYEWFGLSMGANLHPGWNENGAEGISFLFAWMYKDGNLLSMGAGLLAVIASAILSITISTDMFEQETDPVRRGMAFVWISIGSIAIGLAMTFVGMALVWLFVVCAAIITACIAVAIIGGVIRLAAMSELASITIGILAGALFGLAHGWTDMQFGATTLACVIGAVVGCTAAYAVCLLGRTQAFQNAYESVTR
jgi:hypothetical protein